jgi:hypothetical protein
MPLRIRPRRVRSWPRLFWRRAESSYCGNDLQCRSCGGGGLAGQRAVCPACLGSGLLVPRRKPADPAEIGAAEVAWTCVTNRQLVWPRPWIWEVPLLFVRGARDLYFSDDHVLAYMDCGRLTLATFRLGADSAGHLASAYWLAVPGGLEPPEFVMPATTTDRFR